MSVFSIFQKQKTTTPAAPKVNNLFIPQEKRQPKTIYKVQPNGRLLAEKITPQYSGSQDIATFTKENPIEFKSTYYNPDDTSQTSAKSVGRSPYNGKLIDWGQVGRSNRGIPYGTKIYVPELNGTFEVTDSKNIGYNVPGYFSFDFAVRTDNQRRKELEKMIANNPTMHFYIVK